MNAESRTRPFPSVSERLQDAHAAAARGAARGLFILLCAALAAATAHGQSAADDPFAGVEEMIVTGSATAGLLEAQSTSAVAFDASTLRDFQIEDVGDLAAYVPNLEIRTANATNASFFVRGVGIQDFGANASSSVPIFQDGVPRNPGATQLVGLFDIRGLSVLKGPQGDGNNRNASAGVFLVQTTPPEPDFAGFATINIGRIVSVDSRDANRYDFELAQNAPILGDVLSMRISARYSRELPFWENGCANRVGFAARTPGQTFCGENLIRSQLQAIPPLQVGFSPVWEYLPRYIGEVDDLGIRFQLKFAPENVPLELTTRFEHSRLNRDSTAGQHIGTASIPPPNPGPGVLRIPTFGGLDAQGYRDADIESRANEIESRVAAANPGLSRRERRPIVASLLGRELRTTPFDRRPYRGDFDRPGRTILETYAASATALIDLEAFDIEANAGYVDYRKSERRDSDLSPNIAFPSSGNDQAWSVYGDLELTGEDLFSIPFEWSTGFYTLIEQVEAFQAQTVFNAVLATQYEQEIYSWGVFGKGRYEILEGLELAGGVRYNWERKDFDISLFNPNIPLGDSSSRNQRTWDLFTGSLELKYFFTEDVEAWVKYSKGFKAGHFNPSRSREARNPAQGWADPEQIDALEWAVRFAAWDSRITGLANVFYYRYKNYQVFRLTTSTGGVFRTIQNAQRARNYGAELDITITPLEGWAPEAIERLRLNFKGGWLETNFIEFTTLETRQIGEFQGSVTIDYSGNELITAPNLSATFNVTWPLDLGRLGTFTPQYDMTWNDDTPFDANQGRGELNPLGGDSYSPYTVGNRAYALHNVRLSWEPAGDSGLQVAGYCRNLTDQRYGAFGVDLSNFSTQMFFFLGDPRTCGADVRLTW